MIHPARGYYGAVQHAMGQVAKHTRFGLTCTNAYDAIEAYLSRKSNVDTGWLINDQPAPFVVGLCGQNIRKRHAYLIETACFRFSPVVDTVFHFQMVPLS